MIGIEVDGTTAVLDGDGALVFTVCVVRRRGEDTTTVEVDLGASIHRESRAWIKEDLPVGATLTVRIVDTDAGDPPRRVRRRDPDRMEKAERREYERLKRKYGELPQSPLLRPARNERMGRRRGRGWRPNFPGAAVDGTIGRSAPWRRMGGVQWRT